MSGMNLASPPSNPGSNPKFSRFAVLGDRLRDLWRLGKWKVKISRLRRESRRLYEERSLAVIGLGERAWELRARDTAFAPAFDRVAILEEQSGAAAASVGDLRAELKAQETERLRLEKVHKDRIAKADAELGRRKAVLKKAVAGRSRAEKAQQNGEVPVTADELARLRAEETEQRGAMEQQKVLLDAERQQLARALEPSDTALKDLRRRLKAAEKQVAHLDKELHQARAQLGAEIDAARPANEGFVESYRRIDTQDAEIARIDTETVAVEQRLATLGPGARILLFGFLAIGLAGALVAGWLAFGDSFPMLFGSRQAEMAIRVVGAQDADALDGASAVLFFEGGPVAQYTDVHGAATLILDEARGRRGRLVVEKTGFKVHEQEVRLTSNLVEVRLTPPDPEIADVLVRALDSATGEPVPRAEIFVIAGRDTFQEITDSNGVTRFVLGFLDSHLAVEMSVESKGYEIEHRQVTLLADKLQDISLDRAASQISVTEFGMEEALLANYRPVEDNVLLPGTRATGRSRQGTVTAFTFPGHANTPVLFEVQTTEGELRYSLELYDSKDFLVSTHGTFGPGRRYAIPFTPPADGQYGIRLKGRSRGGAYALTMAWVSGPPEKRNLVPELGLESSKKGMLAVGAWDDYTFEGSANTPLLLKLQRSTGELTYVVELFDLDGNRLARYGTFRDGMQYIPFTPQQDGTFTARVYGTRNYGGYTIAQDLIAGEDRGETRTLTPDLAGKGNLAAGASDDYTFTGHRNSSILFTLQRSSGELVYWFEIFDSQNRRLAQHGRFYDGIQQVPFTPPEDGEYRLRMLGDRSFGSYVLNMEHWSAPAEERGQLRPLADGGSLEGRLAIGAYDEYSFAAQAGEPVTLTTQRQSGNLVYSIFIYDEDGQEVASYGSYHDDLRQSRFEPPATGTYRVHVLGERSFGVYVITLNVE